MTTRTPRRVQRTRTKGGGMPAGAKYVGRGSKYGTPYRAYDSSPAERYGATLLLANLLVARRSFPQPELLVAYPSDEEIRAELAGWDIACWCAVPEPGEPDHCHGVLLLAVVRGEDPTAALWPAAAVSGSGPARAGGAA